MMVDEELFHHEVDQWTVGQLRQVLDGLPDDMPLEVSLAEEPGGEFCDVQVVIGASVDDPTSNVTPKASPVLAISCEFATGDYYRRRGR